MTDLPLTKISETATTIVLGWEPVAGAVGYRFQSNANKPKWSHTWDPARTTVRFARDDGPFRVQALAAAAEGTWPPATPQKPAVHTNYAALNLGSNLDPLWWYNGSPNGAKHCGPGATIEIANDPLGQKGHVQRHIVQSGSVLWGGDRCEVMTVQIGGGMGARFQVRFGLLLPNGFKSGSGGWNSLWDLHYPGNGPAQSPLMAQIRNGGELWMRVMAPDQTNDKLATLSQGVWHTICHDIYQHDQDGFIDTWVDGDKVGAFRGPTLQAGVPNTTYWKQGFYRPPNSPEGTQTYFFTDTLCWYENEPKAMLAWNDVPAPADRRGA